MPIITPLDFEEEILKFRGQLQALKLPPINQENCYKNLYTKEDDFRETLELPDISTAAKRRKLSRRKMEKKAKKDKKSSSEVKKVKKRKVLPVRKIPGEITKSFSIVSSSSGSKYTLIQRQPSSESLRNCGDGLEDTRSRQKSKK